MTTELLMPALSPTMTEGKIARWLKSEGEPVRAGDVLAEIVIPEGTDHVAVNTPIALIAGNGEQTVPAARAPEREQVKAPPQPSPIPTSAAAPRAAPAEVEYTGKTTTMTVREALRD